MPAMRYFLAGLACVLSPLAGAQGCLDQQYLPAFTNGLEVTRNQSVTQTFTVGRSGVLARIVLVGVNHHRGVSTTPLDCSLVTIKPNDFVCPLQLD